MPYWFFIGERHKYKKHREWVLAAYKKEEKSQPKPTKQVNKPTLEEVVLQPQIELAEDLDTLPY